MHALLDGLLGSDDDPGCQCSVTAGDTDLHVDARSCAGRPAEDEDCRATVVEALATRDVDRLRVRTPGVDRHYDEAATALLRAAGRFAQLVAAEEPALAERARTDPLDAAEAAATRAAPVADLAAESGLLEAAKAVDAPFEPAIAPTVADVRVERALPSNARLRTARDLSTGGAVRIYDVPGAGTARYHLEPVVATLDESALATLAAGAAELADRRDEPAPIEAVRSVVDGGCEAGTGQAGGDASGDRDADSENGDTGTADDEAGGYSTGPVPGTGIDEASLSDATVRTIAGVLRRHTRGYGVLEDLFADGTVSDVYVTGPASENPLWVVADGEHLRTNVRLGADEAAALASRLRRESGRSFSRASPTIDATATIGGEQVRAAGVLDPATRGHAFAFRSSGEDAFTLPSLVANGTLPAGAAGLLSVAVRRSAAGLIAGTRGAGKTTTLGALLWELPARTRTVAIEDTPELPVETLQEHHRDVQPLHTTLSDGPGISPTEALRTALRLGESALVLGEVRGEEAAVLYEAMRVGASSETVLGTIHGDGGEDVRERVVGDIGVPESSFAATDLVVTCEQYRTPDGGTGRRVARIEEVIDRDGVSFAALYERAGDGRSSCEDGAVAGASETSGSADRQTARRTTADRSAAAGRLADESGAGVPLTATGRLERGNSHLLQSLARPGESYADLRALVRERGRLIGRLARRGTTDPEAVTTAYARAGERSC